MNFIKSFLTLIFLFSCAKPSNLTVLSGQESSLRSLNNYDSYLALEYLMFSRKLLSVNDLKNSEYFAQKGRDVAHGEGQKPENPLKWQVDPVQIKDMVFMQKRLEDVLNTPKIKFYLPIQTAHLTYLYDCWISRESKMLFRADEVAPCRVRFTKLIDEIEGYIEDLGKDKTVHVEIKEPEFKRFEILFDFAIYKLNEKGVKDLLTFLKYLKTLNGDYRLLVVGNADRIGKELSNETLAFDRAQTVRNYLIKNGVAEKLIELRSIGEDFPDIITVDGAQNQNNRSVAIYVMKGNGNFMNYPLPLLENIIYRTEAEDARVDRGLQPN
jgi:outer membrane protein OmpA-like peptidoglycan-associated protein